MYNSFLILLLLIYLFDNYYAEYNKDLVDNIYDLETLKDFINKIAYDMDDIEDENIIFFQKSVKQTWKDFTI
jgi:hypothetical protein